MVDSKTREISIKEKRGAFSILKGSKADYDFSSLSALRRVLSNQRAKLLHIIKNEKPSSIYDLAKRSNRQFKSVFEDLKLFQRFGFVELVKEPSDKKVRIKPRIAIEKVNIIISI